MCLMEIKLYVYGGEWRNCSMAARSNRVFGRDAADILYQVSYIVTILHVYVRDHGIQSIDE